MVRAIQRFEVSLKAFIVRDGRALFVREADTGYWELPGGRIDVGEEWETHAAVLAREIREELGADFLVDMTDAAVTWTRQRPTDGAFLFLVARLANPGAGEVALSPEHSAFAWLTPDAARGLAFPPLSGYGAGIAALWTLAERYV